MDDLISRQAAIDALNGKIKITGRANAVAVKDYIRLVKDRIEQLPAAERKKGKWIKRGPSLYKCSECPRFSPVQENFCPSCGVEMEKNDEV